VHTVTVPPPHTLFEHFSPVVQALPSSQAMVFAVLTQTPVPVQESSVQGLLSSQLLPPVGVHVPETQWSPVVQPSLSLQVFELLFV
jgi:hypothetical protein